MSIMPVGLAMKRKASHTSKQQFSQSNLIPSTMLKSSWLQPWPSADRATLWSTTCSSTTSAGRTTEWDLKTTSWTWSRSCSSRSRRVKWRYTVTLGWVSECVTSRGVSCLKWNFRVSVVRSHWSSNCDLFVVCESRDSWSCDTLHPLKTVISLLENAP